MVSKNQQKKGEANGMLNLPIVCTQVTLRGNMGTSETSQTVVNGLKNRQNLLKIMVCPVCPWGPHRSRKREMWVLWTFSGRPIYSLLALGGRLMHREDREWSKKIRKR